MEHLKLCGRDYYYDLPNECPYCKNKILSIECNRAYDFRGSGELTFLNLYLIVKCPSKNCHRFFFVKYEEKYNPETDDLNLVITKTYPSIEKPNNLPPKIKEYYPDFWNIYNQSLKAESSNLDQIAGMGYRKALESLVKTYITNKFPSEIDQIEKESLIDQIEKESLAESIKRIEYDEITDLAKAANWLGNDQAHFKKRHPDMGIEEMKNFITALCSFITSEKYADEARNLLKRK